MDRRTFIRRASGILAAVAAPMFIPSTHLDYVPRLILGRDPAPVSVSAIDQYVQGLEDLPSVSFDLNWLTDETDAQLLDRVTFRPNPILLNGEEVTFTFRLSTNGLSIIEDLGLVRVHEDIGPVLMCRQTEARG